MVDEVCAEIEDPERLLGPLLDRNAGEWNFDSAVGLAHVAKRCIERASRRLSAAGALPELNALARRGGGGAALPSDELQEAGAKGGGADRLGEGAEKKHKKL